MYIELDLIKEQLNLDLDYTDQDRYLLTLADVAERSIENYIDDDLSKYITDGEMDAPLQQAALMLITTWYENRAAVTYGTAMKIPHTVDWLLAPYINYASRKIHGDCCHTA
jgi:hypothetical protein